MDNSDPIYKYFVDNQYNLKDATKKSREWFRQQTRLLAASQVNAVKLMRDDPSALTNRPLIGRMYMFVYDPKHKATLPYYDIFPLVLPFRIESDGFYGLNLHYLPVQQRVRLLGQLMKLATTKNITENTRLRLSWATIEATAKGAGITACVKHYLASQMGSQFKLISPPDWTLAAMMPVEGFAKAGKTRVWRESRGRL